MLPDDLPMVTEQSIDAYMEQAEITDLPELPWLGFDLSLGASAGEWIDSYINIAKAISPMTPDIFHESAALWLASVAVARRLVLPMYFGSVYSNLFIVWMALTTLFRKSTALNIARQIAGDSFPHLITPQDTTPEALLSDMAGQQPTNFNTMAQTDQNEWQRERNFAAQRGWILDELSGLLSGAGKDYNAGLVEALLRFYDCDPKFSRSTRQQGRVIVKNSYLSLLGASTPAAMALHITNERLWAMGWWPRFAILTPEFSRPAWAISINTPRLDDLISPLRQLYSRLPEGKYPELPQPLTVYLGTGVHEAWNRYNKAVSYDLLTDDLNQLLYGTYGRLPVHTLKIATLLAALDWNQDQCRIELPHLARGIQIAEGWRASAHRALVMARQNESSHNLQRLVNAVARHEPHGASMRDITRTLRDLRPMEIEAQIHEAMVAELIERMETEKGSRGRPTTKYILRRD